MSCQCVWNFGIYCIIINMNTHSSNYVMILAVLTNFFQLCGHMDSDSDSTGKTTRSPHANTMYNNHIYRIGTFFQYLFYFEPESCDHKARLMANGHTNGTAAIPLLVVGLSISQLGSMTFCRSFATASIE